MNELVFSLDIGGTNTVLALVNKNGDILTQESILTQVPKTFNDYVNTVTTIINRLKDKYFEYKVLGLAIGAPDANYYTGTIDHAVNLKWGDFVPLAKSFEKSTNIKTVVTNDANAAAMGEMLFGGAKGLNNFIEITLGTGFGSGVVINGDVLYGHSGFAGEIGHMELIQNGRVCGCGRLGCTETYVSATGICRTVAVLLGETIDESVLRDITPNSLTSKMIYDAALAGDKIANEAFNITGKYLGRVLADSVAFSSPEAFFLFGGLANAGDLLLNPVKAYFKEFNMRMFGSVKIEVSHLKESEAAILGGAAIMWNELKK